MSEINLIGLLYFFIVYAFKKINHYAGLFMALLPISFFFIKNSNYYINVYALISSLFVFFLFDRYNKNYKKVLEDVLEERKKIEKVFDDLKKETGILLKYEKKNQYIYSIFNILSRAVEISSMKSVERYLNECIGAKTGVYIKSDEGFVRVYGDIFNGFEGTEIYERDGKTIVPLSNGGVYCYVVMESVDSNIKNNAMEIISEISPLVKRIYLFNKIDSLSLKDGLTGLYRRGIFNEKIDEEIIRARNFKHTLGLMMIDIDHFKYINDTYGHQAGDEILKGVSRVVKNCVYETDFVARYGGEEFVVIMPRAEREGSFRKANFIRESVEKEKFKVGLIDIKVTISIGMSYYPDDALTKQGLIEKADKALYHSKEAGRNKVSDCRNI